MGRYYPIQVTCSVDITDGTDTVSANATSTLVNRAPSLTVSLEQGLTAETTSVLCDTTVADLDGTTPTLTYTWTVAGNLQPETSDTFSGPFVHGETIECSVDASDGIDTVSDSASTTVGNSAPIVDTVLLEPNTAYTDSILTVSATISDVDTNQSQHHMNGTSWMKMEPTPLLRVKLEQHSVTVV